MLAGCWLDVGPSSETLESLSEQSPLVPWALVFQMAVTPLESIAQIPDAVGVFTMLQSAKIGLGASLERLQGHLPNEQTARELTKLLSEQIDRYLASMLSAVKIVVDVLEASFVDNEVMKIRLRVENQGSLPLHDLEFRIKPPLDASEGTRFPFVGPGTTIEMAFSGSNQWYSDDQLTALPRIGPEVELSWTGRTLAGSRIHESRSVAIDFAASKFNKPTSGYDVDEPLSGSPYITGSPVKVDRWDVFFDSKTASRAN